MARFRRLTAAEARALTRAELLDRIEIEQAYWTRKRARGMTDDDIAAEREFRRIMYAALDVSLALDDAIGLVEGRPGFGGYFDERPQVADPPGMPTST